MIQELHAFQLKESYKECRCHIYAGAAHINLSVLIELKAMNYIQPDSSFLTDTKSEAYQHSIANTIGTLPTSNINLLQHFRH